jgi:hypothetical protein
MVNVEIPWAEEWFRCRRGAECDTHYDSKTGMLSQEGVPASSSRRTA